MHVVMTITAKHDRYLSASPNSKETAVEAYHMYQAASGLNQVLSAPVQPSDRDAIWATAVMLGVLELASADASSPEESWPLKPSSPSDLQWLRVSDGKKVVWKIANPFRPDSIFHNLSDDWEEHFKAVAPAITPSIERLLSQFADLCHLDGLSTAANSPYYSPVHNLANLLPIDCNPTTILSFMCFLSDIDNAFTGLLERKDPRALLLLAYWYAKVCDYHWYIARRATIECKAICIYLEKYYACDGAIQELLHFPKKSCGLISYRDLEDVTESES
ncbi:hypothetical protein MMC20_001986 [Loxospora ochrophaea]|nr:hypothetical protein [Loxospora ochrophaea]